MPTRGGSTLLLLDCTAHVSSIYHQGVKIPKYFLGIAAHKRHLPSQLIKEAKVQMWLL